MTFWEGEKDPIYNINLFIEELEQNNASTFTGILIFVIKLYFGFNREFSCIYGFPNSVSQFHKKFLDNTNLLCNLRNSSNIQYEQHYCASNEVYGGNNKQIVVK